MTRILSILLAFASIVSLPALPALLALPALPALPGQTSPAFDPVGTWNVSTVDDNGQPMSVVVQIAGKPGAYTGTATTSASRTIPLRELATTPGGMVMLFDLPQGAIVVRIIRDGAKFIGAWGEVQQTFALTAERGR